MKNTVLHQSSLMDSAKKTFGAPRSGISALTRKRFPRKFACPKRNAQRLKPKISMGLRLAFPQACRAQVFRRIGRNRFVGVDFERRGHSGILREPTLDIGGCTLHHQRRFDDLRARRSNFDWTILFCREPHK